MTSFFQTKSKASDKAWAGYVVLYCLLKILPTCWFLSFLPRPLPVYTIGILFANSVLIVMYFLGAYSITSVKGKKLIINAIFLDFMILAITIIYSLFHSLLQAGAQHFHGNSTISTTIQIIFLSKLCITMSTRIKDAEAKSKADLIGHAD
jgi:hypothetical protein